jgi:hypothetical protein
MPTFDFTSPEGKTYSVNGPDGATTGQAFQVLQQHLGLPPGFVLDKPPFDPSKPYEVAGKPAFDPSQPFEAAPQVGMAEDAAKSIGSGLGNATIGTLGALGDLTDYGAKGIEAASNYLSDKLGMARYQRPQQPSVLNNIPTSASLRATVTNPIVSPDYEPQSTLGGYLKTGAELAPALIGGPESLGAKLFTRVAVPAVVSETAGQLTKGTDAEPLVRFVGALVGAGGAGKFANAMTEARAVRAATPALADVKSEASNAYDALTSRNVAIPLPQSTLDNLASDITTTLNNRGIRPSTAASIHAAIDEIKTPATAGAADVADLVAARQNVKGLLSAPDANRAGASIALNKIEGAIEQASPGTMAKINEADKNWAAVKANEALDKRLAKAELRASATDSGMNLGNKIRQNVATYLGSNEARYLSAETKADLKKIMDGTATQNLVRHLTGHLATIMGSAAGYEEGGWAGAVAGAAGIRGLKTLNNRSIANQAGRVAQNIRMRSPLVQQNPVVMPQSNPALLTALIAGGPALSNSQRRF